MNQGTAIQSGVSIIIQGEQSGFKNNFSLGLKISIIFVLLCKVPRGWACQYQAHGCWIHCSGHTLVEGMKACDQRYLLMDKSL